MEEEKPEEKGQKWTYKVEDGDNSLIRGDDHLHYQYYAMDQGSWVSKDWVADVFEGFRDMSLDYSPIDEAKVPAVIAKLDARWEKFLASKESQEAQESRAPGGSQGTPQEAPPGGAAVAEEK